MDPNVVEKPRSAIHKALTGDAFQKFARENGYTAEPVSGDELVKEIKFWWDTYEQFLKEYDISEKK